MQTKLWTLALASSLSAGLFVLVPAAYATSPSPQRTPAATPAYPATTGRSENTIECKMRFTLSGWSAIYKTAHGKGTVTCDNGQTMDVILDAKGGGLTAGAYEINDGKGNFNGVTNIQQILGTYANATAHAGAVKSSHAAAMTKDNVSLTLTGTGNGWNIGAGFSGFTIKRASTAHATSD